MRNVHTDPIKLSEVEAALTRAVESTNWAMASDDSMALAYLQSFLAQHPATRTQLYEFLAKQQPQNVGKDPEIISMEQLHLSDLARLYERAFQGGHAGYVTSTTFWGRTPSGSFVYMINSGSQKPIRLYVRKCRGELRGEVNEDNFTLPRGGSGVTVVVPVKPKGILSFLRNIFSGA